jgi:hypothetical protein
MAMTIVMAATLKTMTSIATQPLRIAGVDTKRVPRQGGRTPKTSHFFLFPDFMFGAFSPKYYREGWRDGTTGEDMRSIDDI